MRPRSGVTITVHAGQSRAMLPMFAGRVIDVLVDQRGGADVACRTEATAIETMGAMAAKPDVLRGRMGSRSRGP